jgi:D-3-phosphoglycerate dehydrogenase / 2-oxoglutarate reductase
MNVVALDPYASPAVAQSANVILVSSLDDLLPLADFLTIHTPLIAATKGMISSHELNRMKPGSRVLNVARGGVFDELALLAALESGHIAGAAIDVFTTEPPHKDPESNAALLIAHPRCIATPHLGASTVEAQENVSIDVCEQVLQILAGDLPRSAVNAPLILPAEYKTLQPFVKLVEKMGSLYTQHYTGRPQQSSPRDTFDLIYQGEIATVSNTKPLFAALVKGLTAPITDHAAGNVNIVNAELIAKERGLFINEQRSRDPSLQSTYSSLITLIARKSSSRAPSFSRGKSGHAIRRHSHHHHAPTTTDAVTDFSNQQHQHQHQQNQQHIISGYCSDQIPHISRLDRFATAFVPEGNLLICHNYDSPGKIGVVGSILGREGVNINFMAVAPASYSGEAGGMPADGGYDGYEEKEEDGEARSNEALMILGVDREVGEGVVRELVSEGGVLNVNCVAL